MRSPYSLYPVHPVWSQPRYQHWAPYRYSDPHVTIRIEVTIQAKPDPKPLPLAKHPYKGQFIDVSS